jgi:type IV pilus assembly protein PilV
VRVSAQRGVAIVEALVSVLLLVFGILGLMKMAVTLMQENVQSRDRLQATFFAEQLIGMALADPTNVGCYAVSSGAACGSTGAQTNATQWATQVKTLLPGATLVANKPVATSAADGTFTVTVKWQKASDPLPHNYTATTNVLN